MNGANAVGLGDEREAGSATLALLERLRLRTHRSSRAHYLAAKRANWRHNLLGVPVVALTTVVGTSIFATISENPRTPWVIVAGVLSLSAAVLASLQTFFKFAERAEKHRNAGAAYAALKRRLDIVKLGVQTASLELSEAREILSEITDSINSLQSESIDAPDATYDQARREQDLDLEGV